MLRPSAPSIKVQRRISHRPRPILEHRPPLYTSIRSSAPDVLASFPTTCGSHTPALPGRGGWSVRDLLPALFSGDSAHLFHLKQTINITVELVSGESRWGPTPTSPCPTPSVGGDGLCGIIDLGGHRSSGDRPSSKALVCLRPTHGNILVCLNR